MYHIVYLTTNLLNGKFYVGVHSTYNLDDGYLGSGLAMLRAIKKHGKHNFKRQILHYCLTAEDTLTHEAQIVNEQFLQQKNVYNVKLGGGCKAQYTDEMKIKFSLAWTEERKKQHSETMAKQYADGKLPHLMRGSKKGHNKGKKQSDEHIQNRTSKRIGCKNTEESKKKMSEAVSYIECPYCHKTITKTINTRYHKDKCKMFTNDNPC